MEERIKAVMASVFGVEPETITDSASPDTIEEWDSLRHMSLVVALENEFDIRFDEDDIPNLLNYQIIELLVGREKDR